MVAPYAKEDNPYLNDISLDSKTFTTPKSSIQTNSRNMKINMEHTRTGLMLTDDSQLRYYFGCKMCPHRGMDRCVDIQRSGYENGDELPVSRIEKGDVHANRICRGRIKEIKMFFKLMDNPAGIRLIMTKNQHQLHDIMEQLYGRLLDIKQEKGALTEDEMNMLDAYMKLARDVGEQLGKRLKQDEGIKLNAETLTPSQINRLIEGAERKELTAEILTESDNEVVVEEDVGSIESSHAKEEVKKEGEETEDGRSS